MIVDNNKDAKKSKQLAKGSIALKAGWHDFKADYFENSGDG